MDSTGIISMGTFWSVGMIIRVIGVVLVVNRAEETGRNRLGWGLFAFGFPIIATIVIYLIKPKAMQKNDGQLLDN